MIKTVFDLCALVLIFVSCAVEAQWAIEDEGCRTPDRGVGTCIKIRSCTHIMNLLDQVPQPLPPRIANLLKSYHCGFEDKQPKVCCPARPIVVNSNLLVNQPQAPQPPDVSRHRNINFLPSNCGHMDTTDRIVNGNKTGIFEFPWMALLSYRTSRGPAFKCGATIINERYILTAAHCITNLRSPLIGVRVGDHNVLTRQDCETTVEGEVVCAGPYQDLAIEDIIPHPQYKAKGFANDIGLLRVTRMDLSKENIRPVCLPLDKTRNYNFTNRNAVVTGWGVTEERRGSDELLKAEIPMIPLEECKGIYKRAAPDVSLQHQQICAGGGKSDSCGGDSGGPLHVVALLHNDQRLIQQGIVSFGPRDCGQSTIPGVYTRVAYYMDWILDNMRQ